MPILRLSQDEAGDQVYKDLKTEILSLYGPKEEDAFKKAIALKMTGTPSSFGKKLTHILCPGSRPFSTCHCARIVFGFWEAQLSPVIKSHLTGITFNATTYDELFKKADEVWLANGGQNQPSVVAATRAPAQSPSPSTSSSSEASQTQVSAVTRGGRGGRGRGSRGSGRGGRGNANSASQNTTRNSNQSNTQKPHQKGPKASPDVPDQACARHWKEGRNANYCSDPLVCPWVHIIAPRQKSA